MAHKTSQLIDLGTAPNSPEAARATSNSTKQKAPRKDHSDRRLCMTRTKLQQNQEKAQTKYPSTYRAADPKTSGHRDCRDKRKLLHSRRRIQCNCTCRTPAISNLISPSNSYRWWRVAGRAHNNERGRWKAPLCTYPPTPFAASYSARCKMESAHTIQTAITTLRVLTVVLLKVKFYWDVAQCHWLNNFRRFERSHYLHLQHEAAAVHRGLPDQKMKTWRRMPKITIVTPAVLSSRTKQNFFLIRLFTSHLQS